MKKSVKLLKQYTKKLNNNQGGVILKKGIYKHFKGNLYEVIDIALHSETMEEMVVYRALYGEERLWVRPALMWDEVIEHDGEKVKRFQYVGESADK